MRRLNIFSNLSILALLKLWNVFLVGCVLIGLEIVSFQAIVYVNEYLPATQVISVALIGIAFGGLLSFFVRQSHASHILTVVYILLPLSVLLSFFVIIRMNVHPTTMMAMLTIPYVLGSLVISMMFNAASPGRVYLMDLSGAGLGALLAVITIPLMREEGSFFFLGLLATLPLFLHYWGLMKSRTKHSWGILAVAAVLFVVFLGGLVSQLVLDPFNMARIAIADEVEYKGKIFNFTVPKNEGEKPRHELLYSRGSLMERIDIGYWNPKKGEAAPKLYEPITWFNGRANDHVQRFRPQIGWLDRRMPTRLKLGEDPDTLLVGPAAEGLTKPVIALGNGHIDAVEINRAVAGLMLDELFVISGRAYEGMNLTIGDVRTFLERTQRHYDFITLLNTHRIRTIGHQGPPEYCHTVEAMTAYLEHLKLDGFLIFEERNINDRADLGIRRFLRTAMTALKQMGATDPTQHVAVYEFFVCPKDVWFTNRDRCRRKSRYTMVMIKREPISFSEYNHFIEWGDDLGERVDKKKGMHRGIEWMYLPQDPGKNYWTETILAKNIYDVKDLDSKLHNMSTITDDRPFPYDVFLDHEKPVEVVKTTVVLALLMVLFPSIITFLGVKKSTQIKSQPLTNGLLILFFAILGIGYLLIEIVLIQKFQMFLSTPVYSMVIVLGTMLIASGLGGFVSRHIRPRLALDAIGMVVGLGMGYYWFIESILESLIFLPFFLRIAASILLIAPVAFFMGMPFPYAMSFAKKQLSERHAGLFFGINGALGAVATPVSILLSMTYGFGLTILAGIAAYAICLGLLFTAHGVSAKRELKKDVKEEAQAAA